MANIYPYLVEFKNKFNTNFDLITAISFDGSFDTPTANIDMEQIYSERFDGTHIVYGHKFTSPTQITITFIKKNYKDFTNEESRQFLKWIGGRNKIDWLKLYDQDMEEVCEYLGSFTEILEQTADSRTLGYMATFTATTPWAYSPVRDVRQIFTGTDTIIIESSSDVQDMLIRPYMTIQSLNGDITKLSIKNETTNRTTIIQNIKNEEILTLDNEHKLLFSNNDLRVMGQDFFGYVADYKTNYPIFIELDPSTNNRLVFEATPSTSKISYSIQYRMPIQIGGVF